MLEIEPCGHLGSCTPRKAGSYWHDEEGNLYRSALVEMLPTDHKGVSTV